MTPAIDVHTHTVASGHAFSTVQEMARAAAEKGLQWLGITDHAPSVPGAGHPGHFRNIRVVPHRLYGVNLLFGVELNILDTDGTLDFLPEYMSWLDVRIAGIHRQCWKGGTRAENTDAVLKVMADSRVNIIAHPCDGTAGLDLEPLVRASRDSGTLLEVNNSSLFPWRHKDCAPALNLELLRLCRQYDVPVILGSDAHFSGSVADYTHALALVSECSFPEELIINSSPAAFFDFTGLPIPEGTM